ncbi:hypothetical protein HYU45_00665 [Candidatus Daviesbacteria bacterium]|nr:hypothetical protein [Candidatus Daviesbacteria bacterium]
MKLNPGKVGLTVGAFAGLWHVVWGILVALGWASALQSWILDLHFLNNPFTIQPFDITKWVTLILVTAIIGYIFGFVFANLWNRIQK